MKLHQCVPFLNMCINGAYSVRENFLKNLTGFQWQVLPFHLQLERVIPKIPLRIFDHKDIPYDKSDKKITYLEK